MVFYCLMIVTTQRQIQGIGLGGQLPPFTTAQAYNFQVSLPKRFVSLVFFFYFSLPCSFSVFHVSVDSKIQQKKKTRNSSSHVFNSIELVVNVTFDIGLRGWTDVQMYGRSRDYQNFSHLQVTFFLTHGAMLHALRARKRSPISPELISGSLLYL